MGFFVLAWRYLVYYRGRSIVLLLAIALTLFLPMASRIVIHRFEVKIRERAAQTPLVVGAKGSRLAVAMHALYFKGDSPGSIKLSEADRLESFQLGQVIPLHAKFQTARHRIVGTSPAYFSLRGLVLASGEPLERLGDCVVGANAAQRLAVRPEDKLISESESLFDLGGAAPLKLRITGILQASGTADDDAIFCSLKTTWIMEGIGHGHALEAASSESNPADEQLKHTHPASQQNLPAYEEVTRDNLNTFHFHGQRSEYPLTAIIVVPDSVRSATLLQGKYLDPASSCQIILPVEIIDELMQTISRIRSLFDIGMLGLLICTAILIGLILIMSIRMRDRELNTLFLLGSSRGTTIRLIGAELILVFGGALILAVSGTFLLAQFVESWLIRLI